MWGGYLVGVLCVTGKRDLERKNYILSSYELHNSAFCIVMIKRG